MTGQSTSGYTQQDPEDSASDWAARQFQINQTLAHVRTMALVKVMGIAGGAGAIAAPGTVNVQPLVKIVDGDNNASSHGTIYNIPVYRFGGGDGAIICDPAEGDIGWMAVADRDSSVVVKTKTEAQPGSRRKFDLADGVYMGKLLGDVPVQYIVFSSDGMKWHDRNNNNIVSDSTGISINGILFNRNGQVQGNLPVTGNFELGGSFESLTGGLYAGNIHIGGTMTADVDVIAGTISGKLHTHQYLKPTTAASSPADTGNPQ